MTLRELRASYLKHERELIRAALAASDWRLMRAARMLGVSPDMLRAKLTRGKHPQVWAEYRLMAKQGRPRVGRSIPNTD